MVGVIVVVFHIDSLVEPLIRRGAFVAGRASIGVQKVISSQRLGVRKTVRVQLEVSRSEGN